MKLKDANSNSDGTVDLNGVKVDLSLSSDQNTPVHLHNGVSLTLPRNNSTYCRVQK